MKTETLFEIGLAYRAIMDEMDVYASEHDGDVSGFPLLEKLAAVEESLEKKILNVACLVKEFKSIGEAIKDLGESMVKRGQAHINRANGLKTYIGDNLPANAKFENAQAKVNWQTNGGLEAVTFMPEIQPKDLPTEFQIPKIEADLELMRFKAVPLENGKRGIVDANGRVLAEVARGRHVRIR